MFVTFDMSCLLGRTDSSLLALVILWVTLHIVTTKDRNVRRIFFFFWRGDIYV